MQKDIERKYCFKPYNIETAYTQSTEECLKIPAVFIDTDEFKDLSLGAKLVYSVMRDRAVSQNEDSNGYIYMPIIEIQDIINCGRWKALNIINQLKDFELIQVIRQGQGKPNKIYVKDLLEGY